MFMRHRPVWERIIVFLSAPIIAVISNIARIALTGVLYYWVSSEIGHKFSHDLAGWFMMPIAIGLLWLELELLSALFIDTVEFDSGPGSRCGPDAAAKLQQPRRKEEPSRRTRNVRKPAGKPSDFVSRPSPGSAGGDKEHNLLFTFSSSHPPIQVTPPSSP